MEKKESPKISVIIPTYNRKSLLKRAINSALQQTYENLEIIVVDDGSTDKTEKIIRNLQKKSPKILYFKKNHSGLPSISRNLGIKKSKGEWICFLDDDDYWSKNKIYEQYNFAKSNEYDFVSILTNVQKSKNIIGKKKTKTIKYKDLISENIISTSSVMIKRSLLNKSGLFNESSNLKAIEDYELWLRVLHFTNMNMLSKSNLVFYRDDPKNSIRKNSLDKDIQRKNILRSINYWEKRNKLKITNANTHMSPLISVLLPFRNTKEKYLFKSIDSILNQTMNDIELLLLDDNSKREYKDKILKKYKNNNQIVYIKFDKKTTLSKVLNKGIKIAKGKYIARMDSDDISLSNRLEIQKQFLDNRNDIFACGSWVETFGEKKYIRKSSSNNHYVKAQMLFECPIVHPTAMFRNTGSNKFYYHDYGSSEDYDFWYRISKNHKIINISKVLLSYRIHKDQVGNKYIRQQQLNSKIIRNKILKETLGIVPSNYETKIHESLSDFKNGDQHSSKEIYNWIVKLKKANSSKKYYEKRSFDSLITWKFIRHFWTLSLVNKFFSLKYLLKPLIIKNFYPSLKENFLI